MTTHKERIQACLQGEVIDRPPVALWRHFPVDDQSPGTLAKATLHFQQNYAFDLVKVTPASSFCVRDWGVEDEWRGDTEGYFGPSAVQRQIAPYIIWSGGTMTEIEYFGKCQKEGRIGYPTYIPVRATGVANAYGKIWNIKPSDCYIATIVEKNTGAVVWYHGDPLPQGRRG